MPWVAYMPRPSRTQREIEVDVEQSARLGILYLWGKERCRGATGGKEDRKQ